MNYTLQLHGERMIYPVPPGLYDLTSDITKEVLRDQPTMLYEYIARYLDTLVRVRDYTRTAEEVVDEVIGEKQELLGFVRESGLSWSEVNTAARIIQRVYRSYQARKATRLKVLQQHERLKSMSFSDSFTDYLESLGLDLEKAEEASEIIQNAYKSYQIKKEYQTSKKRKSKDVSTHTIDAVAPKGFIGRKTLLKRDSKLLVYQESRKHSVESTWSTLAREISEKEGRWKPPITKEEEQFGFVYEKTSNVWERGEMSSPVSESQNISTYSTIPEDKVPLPYYYDEAHSKIPMISESGLLKKEESVSIDIVTLFSTDSADEDKAYSKENILNMPSLSKLNAKSRDKMAKELFDIIDKKSPPTSRSLKQSSPEPDKNDTKKLMEEFVKKDMALSSTVSKKSLDKRMSNASSMNRSVKSGVQSVSGMNIAIVPIIKEEPSQH